MQKAEPIPDAVWVLIEPTAAASSGTAAAFLFSF